MAETADSGDDIAAIDARRGELLKVLVRHEVRFVVIGGAAIQSHGRRYVTEDIDVTPDTEASNLHRLADALNELDCQLLDRRPADLAQSSASGSASPLRCRTTLACAKRLTCAAFAQDGQVVWTTGGSASPRSGLLVYA